MLYLYVVKNTDGTFRIVRVITNNVNQRGNSGITYGDLNILDLETRKAEGFWTQKDIYQDGDGQYMEYIDKVVDFDEDNAIVTNTYIYQRMDLTIIKNDLKNRVDSKRDEKVFDKFTFQDHTYSCDVNSRLNILSTHSAMQIDESIITPSFVWRTTDEQNISMDAATFKQFVITLFNFISHNYQQSWTVKAAIDAASTYEDVRAAAVWDGQAL